LQVLKAAERQNTAPPAKVHHTPMGAGQGKAVTAEGGAEDAPLQTLAGQ